MTPTPATMTEEQQRIACAEELGFDLDAAMKRMAPCSVDYFLNAPSHVQPDIARFTTDLNAAITLVDHLAKQGWLFDAHVRLDGKWTCCFKLNGHHHGSGETLPAAIVDAFLCVTKEGKE